MRGRQKDVRRKRKKEKMSNMDREEKRKNSAK